MSGNPFDFGADQPPKKSEPVSDPSKKIRRRRRDDDEVGFRCPYCNSSRPPEVIWQTSTAGWIMFWVLFLIMCWPFFLFGLTMKEQVAYCEDCGMKLPT